MPYTSDQLKELFQQGESQTVEFKSNIREPNFLAREIAAFANTEGGLIVVGVNEPIKVVGIDPSTIKRIYKSALRKLSFEPKTSLEIVSVDGKQIALISVDKSNELVLSNEGAFQRIGEQIRPMSTSNISTALAKVSLEPARNESIAE